VSAEPEALWTVDQLAAYLAVGTKGIYRMASSGSIPSVHVGGRLRFRPAEIVAWLDRQASPAYGGGPL
jgi:excisionase family DNA binding protein